MSVNTFEITKADAPVKDIQEQATGIKPLTSLALSDFISIGYKDYFEDEGGIKVLVVNIIETETKWELDKTWAEIKAAVDAGVAYVSYNVEGFDPWTALVVYCGETQDPQYNVGIMLNSEYRLFTANNRDNHPQYVFE
jgi:hypothetical protein